MRILGIDPGAKGALALVEGYAVKLVEMPRLMVRRGNGDKDEVDGFALVDILPDMSPDLAYLEQAGGMDGQSASAAFNFGQAAAAPQYPAFSKVRDEEIEKATRALRAAIESNPYGRARV